MRKHNVNVQKRKKHYTVGAILWLIVEYVSLIFFGLCAVVPVISCVITAFKTQEEYQTTNVMTLPKNWLNFDNFIKEADTGKGLKFPKWTKNYLKYIFSPLHRYYVQVNND